VHSYLTTSSAHLNHTKLEDSILEATKGGRLLLVILTSSSCDKSTDFIHNEATLAANMIDESFITLDFNLPTSATKPLIGIIDNTSENFSHLFGTITHYPSLKFIRLVSDITTTSSSEEENEECDNAKDKTCQEESQTSVESEGGEVLQTWEYISSRETAKDIHETVLLYWYRHVVSNAMSNQSNESTIDSGRAPIFTFSSQTDLSIFLQTHGRHALKPAQPRRQHHSKLEEEVFSFYMGINEDLSGVFHNYEYINDDDNNDSVSEDEQFTQEIDPYLLLVQCRSQFDYGEVELMEDKTDGRISTEEMILLQNQQQAVQDFDQLAEQMATRSDVAFVALNASIHDTDMIPDPIEHVCDGLFDEIGGPSNGDVAFIRARRYVTYSVEDAVKNSDHQDKKQQHHNGLNNHQRKRVIHNIETDWGDGVKLLSPHAIVVPSSSSDETISKPQKEIHGKLANKDPTTPVEYIQSNLVASTIVHSTPTVMWYDKERIAQLAFPWYRKVHAVLFVDMALSYKEWRSTSSMNKQHPSWPSSLYHSKETATLLLSQQKAIQMFYDAALRHRVKRPADDLVFLIVPSSEIRIMTSFGVDIWTPLDEALFSITDDTDDEEQEEQEYQQGERINGYCNSPNNGESRNILPVMMITDSTGRSGLQSSRYYLCSNEILSNDGAIEEFIDKFFKGTIEPFTRSESTPTSSEATATTRHSQSTNKPNVTILTGNSFESLVMNRRDEHQILFITSYSCGHCKRFSIFWNELSMLIQALNWDSVISVMKIDVSKNDVPHEKINAWDLPAVYYFPAYDKPPIKEQQIHENVCRPLSHLNNSSHALGMHRDQTTLPFQEKDYPF